MSKQINISLAKSGDVAVLDSGEQKEILRINFKKPPFGIRIIFDHFSQKPLYYQWFGSCGFKPSPNDITDILREGVSIFEPK